ncbi:MAG: hydroxyacid dehydrogenase [Candidatus Methylacidiphilales bacterium]|nr:hydroxyacid dehydrogenase [Candidatus Methylacidiphilales bacterium]
MSARPIAVIVGNHGETEHVFPPTVRARLAEFAELRAVDLDAAAFSQNLELLASTELLLGTWGMPVLDAEFLARLPRLRGVFYGAGSVKGFIHNVFWDQPRVLSSASAANAVPVAEFTVAAIVLSLKKVWQHLADTRTHQRWQRWNVIPGNYRTTVGLVSLGLIGRLVAERLQVFDHRVLIHDPFAPESAIRALGAEPATLAGIFAESDVVSLHTPWLPETVGMVHAGLLDTMKPHATLLNTARGALINEDDLFTVLKRRPDLTAFVDVTHPEPPVAHSPFYTLPNVFLTPHIAGSLNAECGRMGELAVEEAHRFISGQPLQHEITREQLARMA